MEEATAVEGMVELQATLDKASITLPNENLLENAGSGHGLNTGLVYTPMRITRSMASFNSKFTRSLGLAGGGTPVIDEKEEAGTEVDVDAEHESTGGKKTGKRTIGRGARKEWGKSSVVNPDKSVTDKQASTRKKKGGNVKPVKAANGKQSKAQTQAGKKKAGAVKASGKKEKQGESVVEQVGEDVSSGVTEGDTAKANQLQTKQKLSSSSSPVGWVMCDDCNQWRCISTELADQIEASNARWTCRENPNKEYADCSVPQEKSNAEINAELDISDASSSGCEDADAVVNSKSRATWTWIQSNIFVHREPKQPDEDECLICQCEPPKAGLGCGDDCLNRMMNVECSPETCPCGDRCSNQQFKKKMYAPFALERCGKKGFGLRACEFVPKGSFIIEYVGEVLGPKAFKARQKDYDRQRQKHFYFMTLDNSEIIDACRKGNHGRFINHSCEPNCQTEKWVVNGEICIGLFAIKDVRENEEITFNYNFERLLGAAAKKCRCGSHNCRGYIGGDPSNPKDVVPSDSEEDLEPVMLKEDDSEEDMDTHESAQDLKATPASDVLPWGPNMELESEAERGRGREPQPKPEPALEPEVKSKPLPKLSEKTEPAKPKTRIKRLKSSGRPRKAELKPFKPIATTRKSISEVEEKLDTLLNPEGGLVKKKDTPKQYLKLLVISTASGDPSTSCNMRDLSLLLDAILKTASRSILAEIIQKNGLQLLHNLAKQCRKTFTKTPILRKLLKVLEFIAEKKIINSQDMTLTAPRNGMESFVKSIFELQRHEDSEVQQLSRRFQKQWLPDAYDLLAHENFGSQSVHRHWGPDRFSQRRELFHSRPDDRQRKYNKRPDDSDRQERSSETKRRRVSRWDEAPSSAPSYQSRSGSQESLPTTRWQREQEDASEPPGYAASRSSHSQQPVEHHQSQPRSSDYQSQPRAAHFQPASDYHHRQPRPAQAADYHQSSQPRSSHSQPVADYHQSQPKPAHPQPAADYHQSQPRSCHSQQPADYHPRSSHSQQAADHHHHQSQARPSQPVDYHHSQPRFSQPEHHPREQWNHPREQARENRGSSYYPPNDSSYCNDYSGRRQYHQEVSHLRYSRAPPPSRPAGFYYPPQAPYAHPHAMAEQPVSHYNGCYSHPAQQQYPDDEPPVPGL